MIFLLLLYNLLLRGNVLALSLPSLHPTFETSFYPRVETNPDKFTQRSEWNIILSCFTTIFTCSWVAIHPNIPRQSDGPMRIALRRLMIMTYMLIVPEAVIYWAGRQWHASRYIAKEHKSVDLSNN